MSDNRLQLNHSKTEVLWCSSTRRQHQPITSAVTLVWRHVGATSCCRQESRGLPGRSSHHARSCNCNSPDMFRYSATDQQHTTLHTTSSVADSILRALVISKLDYCCNVLAGLPGTLLRGLQSVLNAATRLVFSASKYSHASPLLLELHWLKVPERIKFRLCVLVYRCLNGAAPSYLAETICPVSSHSTRHRIRSAGSSKVY